MHLIINSVKVTFFSFPHKLSKMIDFEDIIKMPPILDIAAMKAYALGGRAKWKDYVDLYHIFKSYYSFNEIAGRAEELFENFFNPKLFREQLTFFKDIDYREKVVYLKNEISEKEIQDFLTNIATEPF